MRLLFLSNFLPPASLGGYEAWCREVAEQMRDWGHEVTILTSNHNRETAALTDPTWVRRELGLEMPLVSFRNSVLFFTHRETRESDNLRRLERAVDETQPEAILVWGMWNLHLSLARLAERLLPGRVSYYLSDYWPTLPNPYADYWRAASQSRPATAAKALLRPAAERRLAGEKRMLPAFAHAMTPSAFVADELRRQKIALGAVEVVPGGIDTRRYARPSEHQGPADDSLSLLYVGRLTPEKGIETAIEALGLLRRERGLEASHLVVAGTGSPAYQEKLRVKAAAAGPVVFLGKQTEDALPAIYRAATALLFTSIWPEPFARVPLEAMAAGTPVIGTTSGGSEELLRDGENCLTYPAGDAAALAQAVKRLWKDPALRRRLIRTGQREVCDKYDLKHMVGGVEAHLLRLTTRPDPHFR